MLRGRKIKNGNVTQERITPVNVHGACKQMQVPRVVAKIIIIKLESSADHVTN